MWLLYLLLVLLHCPFSHSPSDTFLSPEKLLTKVINIIFDAKANKYLVVHVHQGLLPKVSVIELRFRFGLRVQVAVLDPPLISLYTLGLCNLIHPPDFKGHF